MKYISILVTVLISTVYGEELHLQFKPFDKLMYYRCDIASDKGPIDKNERNGDVVGMRALQTEPKTDKIYLLAGEDTTIDREDYITPNGLTIFWSKNLAFGNIAPGMWLDYFFTTSVNDFIMPFFNDRSSFKIGDEFSYKIKSPFLYSRDIELVFNRYVAKGENYTKKALLLQKIVAVEQMLGYECAKIQYTIKDQYKNRAGTTLQLNVSGIVYFAIKEGIIVSDIADGYQDVIKGPQKVLRQYYFKKMRLLPNSLRKNVNEN